MTAQQARAQRTIVETREYERTVDVELVTPRRPRATSLTVVVLQQITGRDQRTSVTLMTERTKREGRRAHTAKQRHSIGSDIDLHWSEFDEPTRDRLRMLREQVLVEFGTINWEEVTS